MPISSQFRSGFPSAFSQHKLRWVRAFTMCCNLPCRVPSGHSLLRFLPVMWTSGQVSQLSFLTLLSFVPRNSSEQRGLLPQHIAILQTMPSLQPHCPYSLPCAPISPTVIHVSALPPQLVLYKYMATPIPPLPTPIQLVLLKDQLLPAFLSVSK